MKGHEQLRAQQAVAGLVGPHIQPLTLLELADTQVHHPPIHLHPHKTPLVPMDPHEQVLRV